MAAGAMARGWVRRAGGLFRAIVREAVAAAERTPVEVALAVVTWMAFAAAVEARSYDVFYRVAVTAGLVFPVAYAASVLHARGVLPSLLRWLATVVAVLLAAVYGFGVFSTDLATEGWRLGLLLAAAWSILVTVPLVRDRGWAAAMARDVAARTGVHRFAARLAGRVAGAGVYAGALFVGLAVAVAAVEGLFGVRIPATTYAQLAGVLFFLVTPWAVAAGLPQLLPPPAEAGDTAVSLLRRAGVYLLVPLVLLYMGIVYAYMVRVVVTGEVPKNLVSPVVLGAGALVLLALLVLEPLRGREDARGLIRFVDTLPPLLLPLSALALWAVWIRIAQYGWTEFRYLRFVALLGLAAFAGASIWRLLRRSPPPLAVLPPALAVALLLLAVGPASAPSIAHRDQAWRLGRLLAEAEGPRELAAPATVDRETYLEIGEKARYLGQHFGWASLADVAPGGAVPEDVRGDRWSLAAALGVAPQVDAQGPIEIVATLPHAAALPGVMAGTLYGLDRPALGAGAGWTGDGGIRTDTLDASVELELPDGEVLRAELAALLAGIAADAERAGFPTAEGPIRPVRPASEASVARTLSPEMAVVPLRDPTTGAVRGQLLLNSLALRSHRTGDVAGVRLLWWNGLLVVSP